MNAFCEDTTAIRWSHLTPDQIPPALEQAFEEADAALKDITSLPPNAVTFDNTFLALENATETLNRVWGRVGHLDSVCNSDALREVHNEWLPKVSAFYAQIPLNAALWDKLKACSESDEMKALPAIRDRLRQETLRLLRQIFFYFFESRLLVRI